MTERTHLSAELQQGCTAGCGKPIEIGMSIALGENGWEHSSCLRAGTHRLIRPFSPNGGSAEAVDLERRLEKLRGGLDREEISYVEDMIRRRRAL